MDNTLEGYCILVVNGLEVRRVPASFKTRVRSDHKLNITLITDLVFEDVPPGMFEIWATPSKVSPPQVKIHGPREVVSRARIEIPGSRLH